MNFYTHYNNIATKAEKRKLRNEIIQECEIQHSTFYSWLSRKKIPALAQKVICKMMNIPQSELFPELKTTEQR